MYFPWITTARIPFSGTIFAKHIHYKFQHLWHNFRKAHPLQIPASLAQFSQSTSITNSSIFGTIFAKHFKHAFYITSLTRIPAFSHSLLPTNLARIPYEKEF